MVLVRYLFLFSTLFLITSCNKEPKPLLTFLTEGEWNVKSFTGHTALTDKGFMTGSHASFQKCNEESELCDGTINIAYTISYFHNRNTPLSYYFYCKLNPISEFNAELEIVNTVPEFQYATQFFCIDGCKGNLSYDQESNSVKIQFQDGEIILVR